ncbi:Tigger transposable element derived 4 [Phytophthora megakarya]|uniref:Tigger transposable element derived 4 n=1 Tax=Phytophthora megakarya TaxID=4795 RepID=A0A225VY28_9STRA|nr:Tigger transposable element derived 4 [Phytophthora megakarya]
MIIRYAHKLFLRLAIPISAQPCLGWSWLRHLQARYGIKWRRAYGESGAVNLEAVTTDLVEYKSSNKAGVITELYQAWPLDPHSSMRRQNRNILLLVDNASSHCDDGLTLTNVRVEKLPPNTTSKLQPLDQGFIYWVKRTVLSKKMDIALYEIENGNENPYKVGMLRGIQWCAEAWQDLSQQTIEHR